MTDLFKETLAKYPKWEWVKPTNNGSNDYDIFCEMYGEGLVECKHEDHYTGKILTGRSFYFKS